VASEDARLRRQLTMPAERLSFSDLSLTALRGCRQNLTMPAERLSFSDQCCGRC